MNNIDIRKYNFDHIRSLCAISLTKRHENNKNKPNLFGHNFQKLNEASFDFELRQTDWKTILEIDKKETDFSKKLRKN